MVASPSRTASDRLAVLAGSGLVAPLGSPPARWASCRARLIFLLTTGLAAVLIAGLVAGFGSAAGSESTSIRGVGAAPAGASEADGRFVVRFQDLERTVAEGERALAAAEAAYEEAGVTLADAVQRYRTVSVAAVALEGDLRQLDRSSLERVLAFESTRREARELALDSYVRGGAQGELYHYLDAEDATDVALRRHLVTGGVDRANEAAFALRTERLRLDARSAVVAADVAALANQLDEADVAVATARKAQKHTYEELLVAYDLLVTANEAAKVEAAAAAERARRATTAGPGSEPSSPPPTEADPPEDDSPARGGASPRPPPSPPPHASDDQADAWVKLRECESGGNYQAIGGGGLYRGAYQFSQATWEAVGGTGDPAQASPAEQDYRARLLYERSGGGQWPLCGRYLQ